MNKRFGAKYAGTKTGIIYNNVMNDFSIPGFSNSYGLKASKSNRIAPMKRPVSSMSPIIIVDRQNRVRLALGASGGSRIISAVLQVEHYHYHHYFIHLSLNFQCFERTKYLVFIVIETIKLSGN